jgi:AraC-like DNA-binding protein
MLDRTEVGQSVDVLAEILDTVHVQVAEASVIWADQGLKGEDIETAGVVIFVVRAGCVVCELGGQRIEIDEGDAIALLRGGAGPGPEGEPSRRNSCIESLHQIKEADAVRALVGQGSVLRCACHFADPEKNPLLGAMPRFIHVKRHQWVEAQWLEPTVAWIEREAAAKSPGTSVVVNRLIELLWIQLVRTHIATTPDATRGWLRALSDAQIGGALCLIHEKPAASFTVAGLAQAVGMSRSAFASQFTRLVGEPPLHYVARWRMLKASQLLKQDKQTLAEVAIAVGYESEAAFSKAFKRWSGQAPGSYRRDQRTDPAPVAQMLAG